jgi:hypothetical protein
MDKAAIKMRMQMLEHEEWERKRRKLVDDFVELLGLERKRRTGIVDLAKRAKTFREASALSGHMDGGFDRDEAMALLAELVSLVLGDQP